MKKRGLMTLLMAATLLVAPPALESFGVDLPVMTVTATGNNSSSGSVNRPSASGNNSQGSGNTGSGNTSTGSGNTSTGSGNTSTGSGSSSNRPAASGNNSYGASSTGSSTSSRPAGSTIAVTNPTGHLVSITTSAEDLAKAAGLKEGEKLVATVENSYGPAAEALIKNAAAAANAQIGYIVEINLYNGTEQVNKLNSAIKLVLGAPEGIDGNTYDFAVVRIHEGGEVAVLPDLDSDPATITVSTDRFSAYAVIYAPKGQLKGVKDSVPKTGDTVPVAIPVAATTCLAAAGAVAVALNKRKRV